MSREQILHETLTLRADLRQLRAEEGKLDTLSAYRKELEKECIPTDDAVSPARVGGFFTNRLASSISSLRSSISHSIADEVTTGTSSSSSLTYDNSTQIPTHIFSSSRQRSSQFSLNSRRSSFGNFDGRRISLRSSVGGGFDSGASYLASRRRSSLFAFDVLVQENMKYNDSSAGGESKETTCTCNQQENLQQPPGAESNIGRRRTIDFLNQQQPPGTESNIGRRRTMDFLSSLGLEEERIEEESSSASEDNRSLDDAKQQALCATLSASLSVLDTKDLREHGPRAA